MPVLISILVLCIGANWMHGIPQPPDKDSMVSDEWSQSPLWTWLVLCDDRTWIYHEYRHFLTFTRHCHFHT